MSGSGVDVYKREDGLVLATYARTAQNWEWLNGHFLQLPPSAAAVELGRAVLDCLDAGREIIPHPSQEAMRADAAFKALLKTMGLRSRKAFHEGTTAVSVLNRESGLLVEPTVNGGPSRGFEYLPERPEPLADCSPEAVGAAVLEAFQKSK